MATDPRTLRDGAYEAEVARRYAARERLWRAATGAIRVRGKSVLDAGTGEGYLTHYLARRRPGRLVSVTCIAEEIDAARRRLGGFAGTVDFRRADLTEGSVFAEGAFDLIVGDYLLAAAAAYSPYREIDLLRNLRDWLERDGTLVLTGWEATGGMPSPLRTMIGRLFATREAAHQLIGSTPFREYPSRWVGARLAELGFSSVQVVTEADRHHDLRWLVRNTLTAVQRVEAADLRGALERRVADLNGRIHAQPELATGFAFGRLYAVVARRAGGMVLR